MGKGKLPPEWRGSRGVFAQKQVKGHKREKKSCGEVHHVEKKT